MLTKGCAICAAVSNETGWRIGGKPAWLHGRVGEQVVCYVISPQRNADALESVIGIDYDGTLIHDGFSTYDRFEQAVHQQCVAHVMRRAHALEENLSGRNKEFPRQVNELFKDALAVRDEFERAEPGEDKRGEKYEEFCDRLDNLTNGPRVDEANQRLSNHLYNHGGEWFMFLLQPGQPATNFEGEQALKTPIVNRKVFGGNREDSGARVQETLSTVIETCKRQEKSAFGYIKSAVCGVIRSLVTFACGMPVEAEMAKEESGGSR